MDTALWIVAGLLAAVYLFAGGGKIVVPKERIFAAGAAAHWVEDFRPGTLKAIGVLEVLGAAGLVLPPLLGVAPVLAPLAAVGLALVMVGAAVTRVRRREFAPLVVDLVYLALNCFVAWGRLVAEPFTG